MDSHETPNASPPQPAWLASAQSPVAPKKQLSRGAIVALSACTAVLVGISDAGGILIFSSLVARASAASQALKDHNQFEQALYGAQRGSSGSGPSSGSGSFGSGSSNGRNGYSGGNGNSSVAATTAQASGIVLINTVLSYQQAEAAGTGMVLTSNGEILTNNHVVAGATSVSVTVAATGKSYTANVVGTDATDDVAVLQLTGASGLKTAKLDSSGSVRTGDAVTGVGNAGGTGTLTAAAGNVTALDQTITTQAEGAAASETLNGLIQTNADIQAGDSGGPLYDSSGAIVGIDTAASSGTTQTEGYAIPIEDALAIARQIESGNASSTVAIGYPAFLGVEVGSRAASGGLGGFGSQNGSGSTHSAAGAPIAGVITGGPAAGAGLVAGDTITAINGTTVSSASSLTQVLAGYKPGQTVTVTWTDASGASQSAIVTLATGPAA
ncbi:MAG: PDZ domain-containing protein [Microbacteriaceae bacterium]|nr:MAG: PDZ domain-containing protein [Microbacteriaceae bacterium]